MPGIDDFDSKTRNFTQWLVANGVEISPKVAIHDYRSQNQGRGLRALEDIEEDEVLFTIPRTSVISVDNDEEFSRFLSSGEDETDPWFGLIAYMMSIQNDEKWKPYFDILPSTFNTPMFWNTQEVSKLKGSALIDKIGKEEAEVSYNEQIGPLISSQEGKSRFFSSDTSVNAFHRMGSLIMSYGFDIEAKEKSDDDDDINTVKAMVPLADILNAHTRLCNAHLCHTDENKVLEMRSIKKIAKGEQIYNTYGELPNSDLMRRYGYAQVGGTEFDVVEISTDSIINAVKTVLSLTDKELESQLDQLRKFDPEGDILDEAYDVPLSGEFEAETIVVTVFLQLTKVSKDYKLQSVLESIYEKAQSGEATVESRPILEKVINNRLAEYPAHLVSEIKNDRNPIPSDEVVINRSKMCEQVLIGEIRILLKCLDWIKECCVLNSDEIFRGLKRREVSQEGESKRRRM